MRHHHRVPLLLEERSGQTLVHRIVLGEEHPRPRAARSDRGARLRRQLWLLPERGHDRIEQLGLLDGFEQRLCDARLFGASRLAEAAAGREHQDRSPAQAGVRANSRRQRETVHLRHPLVEQREPEGMVRGGSIELREGACRADGDLRLHSPVPHHFLENGAVRRIVVHYQHRQPIDRRRHSRPRAGARLRLHRHRKREEESAALSLLAAQAELSTHRLHDARRDGQAEPGSAELARRRRVRLHESLEDRLVLSRRNADPGVADRKAQARRVPVLPLQVDLDHDLAKGGELDRIADKVDQHLPQPGRVCHQSVGNVGRHVQHQLKLLFARAHPQRLHQITERVTQIERSGFDLQLSRVDLGEVEDFVDDPEESLRGREHHPSVAPLVRCQIGIQEQLGHPDHPVHRGADLMAHIGQELALRAAGRLRRFLCAPALRHFGSEHLVRAMQLLGAKVGRIRLTRAAHRSEPLEVEHRQRAHEPVGDGDSAGGAERLHRDSQA